MNIAATFGSCAGQVFAQQIGGPGDQQLLAAAVDPVTGNLFVGGMFEGSINVQGTVLTSAGQGDGLVVKLDPSGNLLWATSFGGPLDDQVYGLSVFSNGDVAMAGRFMSGATFGSTALTNNGFSDVVVARLAAGTGSPVWVQTFGGAYHDLATSVAVGPTGDVFVAGAFNLTVAFGPFSLTSAGDYDVFVAALSGVDGTVNWAQRGGGTLFDEAKSLAVDSNGDVAVTGLNDSLNGDFANNPDPVDLNLIFLAKYSGADGGVLWEHGFGQNGSMGLGVRASGTNLILAAVVSNYADFGNGQVLSMGANGTALTGFNGTGNALWSEGFFQPGGFSWPYGMDLAPDGTLWLVGAFAGTASFGAAGPFAIPEVNTESLPGDTANGIIGAWPWPRDAFVGHYSATGQTLSLRHFGGPGQDLAAGVAAVPDGGALVVGSFAERIDLCTQVMVSDGGLDAYLLRISDDPDAGAGTLTLIAPADAGPADLDAGHSLCLTPGPPPPPPSSVNPPPSFMEGPTFSVQNFQSATVGAFLPDGGQAIMVTQGGLGQLQLYAADADAGLLVNVTTTAMLLPIATDYNPSALIAADFNGDGLADAFIGNYGLDDGWQPGAPNELVIQSPPGTFVRSVEALPLQGWELHSTEAGITYGAAAGDIDCDGAVDIFQTTFATNNTMTTGPVALQQFLMNDGTGHFQGDYSRAPFFTTVLGYSSGSAALCDVNRDGAPDLILGASPGSARPEPHLWVLLNDGYGNFSPSTSSQLPLSLLGDGGMETGQIECLDYDQDGWPDVIYAGVDFGNGGCLTQLAHNNQDGTWTDVTATALPSNTACLNGSGKMTIADLNNDGWPDIVGSPQAGYTPPIWINQGNGTFIEIGSSLPPSAGFGQLIPMDVDGSGMLDLVWIAGVNGVGNSAIFFNNGW